MMFWSTGRYDGKGLKTHQDPTLLPLSTLVLLRLHPQDVRGVPRDGNQWIVKG